MKFLSSSGWDRLRIAGTDKNTLAICMQFSQSFDAAIMTAPWHAEASMGIRMDGGCLLTTKEILPSLEVARHRRMMGGRSPETMTGLSLWSDVRNALQGTASDLDQAFVSANIWRDSTVGLRT